MKKTIFVVAAILLMLCLGGCASQSGSSAGKMESLDVVTPEDVLDQTLEGVGDSAGKSILFKDGGTLEIETEDGFFVGTWEYSSDPNNAFRPLTIAWMVEDKLHGYIALLSKTGEVYSLSGNWYVSDAYIQMYEEYQIAAGM